jgi:hypothetical protein
MLTLELAWLELWLDATTGDRPPTPDGPLSQAEAAAIGDAKSAPPGGLARRWLRHSPFEPSLRFHEAPGR